MNNIGNKNPHLSDEQDNDTPEHHSDADPWFS